MKINSINRPTRWNYFLAISNVQVNYLKNFETSYLKKKKWYFWREDIDCFVAPG